MNNYEQFQSLKSGVCINPSTTFKATHTARERMQMFLTWNAVYKALLSIPFNAGHGAHCGLHADVMFHLQMTELDQLVVFASLRVKVAVETRVIQQSQHLLVFFHAWVFFTCGQGEPPRHQTLAWPRIPKVQSQMGVRGDSQPLQRAFLCAGKGLGWKEGPQKLLDSLKRCKFENKCQKLEGPAP